MIDVPDPTTAADLYVLGGDLPVRRLGYGAMRITGSIWGEPSDRDGAKGGLLRDGPSQWRAHGSPSHLRAACEASLRRLRLQRIDLYQLHTVDPQVPIEESVGALVELQEAGLVRRGSRSRPAPGMSAPAAAKALDRTG